MEDKMTDLKLILDSITEGIFCLDKQGNFNFCNKRCVELLGYKSPEELLGKNMHALIHHSYEDGVKLPIEQCKIMSTLLTGESAVVDNEVFFRADGSSFDVKYNSYPQVKDGQFEGVVVTFEPRPSLDQIHYLGCYDSLTGLMNRGCFEQSMKQYDVRSKLPISIIFADLNGLKLVNDIFGHGAGDKLIKKAANTLQRSCRSMDLLARVGGDEFIVLLPHTEAAEARKVIERVQMELKHEKVHGLSCSMALGMDTKTSYYQNIEKIMSNAEHEMYRMKTLTKKHSGADTINTIMNTLQQRSTREKSHSENIARLCEQMGTVMKLSDPEVKKLKDAGYLHDIGKVVLLDSILNEKHELSEYEKQVKRQHPVIGYRILNLFDDTLDLADVVYAHHERFNGSGYPKGLKGDEIPLISRIIALAECYESLKESQGVNVLSNDQIFQKIRKEAGRSYDPDLVEIFIQMIKTYEVESDENGK